MAKSTNYQCPACTAPLRFDPKSNLLVCDYCDSKFEVEKIDSLYAEKIKGGIDKGSISLKTYTCSSCGAELFCDEVTVASSCPYCSNPNIIAGKFKDKEMPDLVIPFKLEKKEAVEALTKFYKGKKLLPKVFSEENHIEEVKGVYIPFWFFRGEAEIKLRAKAQKVNIVTTSKERIENISHFNIERQGIVPFKNIPVDASVKMDNAMMDSLEPFNYDDLKPFTPSYLPGFFAESYDDDAENCQKRLEARVSKTAEEKMLFDVRGYSSVERVSSEVNTKLSQKPAYAFLPVWLLSTRWKDKNYLFAMNGQTGKMVGKLPVDKGRFAAWLCGIMAGGLLLLTPLIYTLIIKGM